MRQSERKYGDIFQDGKFRRMVLIMKCFEFKKKHSFVLKWPYIPQHIEMYVLYSKKSLNLLESEAKKVVGKSLDGFIILSILTSHRKNYVMCTTASYFM